jgi:hypothetical protein
MIRRRRRQREIAFSFDSFLDVVANVVGIILRLILVAWVGARAYHGAPPPVPSVAEVEDAPEPVEAIAPLPEPQDPLTAELERQRRELAAAQAALLDQLRQWDLSRDEGLKAAGKVSDLTARRKELATAAAGAEKAVAGQSEAVRGATLTLEDLRQRGRKLTAEIEELRRAPSTKHTLRYTTPVSHPLQTEELIVECRRGKVSVIDIGRLVEDAQRDVRRKLDVLRTNPEIRDTTQSIGPFRLRYLVERDSDAMDSVGAVGAARNSFQAHMTYWEVEPTIEERGETADAALAPGSAFRRVMDALEPNQTAVTFWVYPDSFVAYRRLRDYLHDHDLVVAGRPLPEGHPIAFSTRHGSVSRGQ